VACWLGVAAVSLVFGGVHAITLGFGTTLIGEAVDYAIYYLIQARAGGFVHWQRVGWPTMRLGLLTSVCGFAALIFSGFPGLAQLGVFSVAGLVGAAAFTRFVMPSLMPQGARGKGLRRPLGRLGAWLMTALPRWRWPLLALAAAATLTLLARGDLWRAELSSLSPISRQALDLDASLRADLSAGDARTLVVIQAVDAETTLRQAEAAAARLETLVEQGHLAGFDSVSRWVPSLQTQGQRLAALPDAPTLQAALQAATARGPLSATRLAPFVAEVQAARQRAPITPDTLRGTALAPLIDVLLIHRPDGSWAALMPLQPAGDTWTRPACGRRWPASRDPRSSKSAPSSHACTNATWAKRRRKPCWVHWAWCS
jgi:predicted exporter